MKHCILIASINGMKSAIVDTKSNKAIDIDQIKRDLSKAGYTEVKVKYGFPVRCPACNIIVDTEDYPDSHRFCKPCGREWYEAEMKYLVT